MTTPSGLWLPPSAGAIPDLGAVSSHATYSAIDSIDSRFEPYDSEIKAIAAGPLKWAQHRQASRIEIDYFVRGLTHQFERIGIKAEVQPWETEQEGLYVFKVVLLARLDDKHEFDYDRQVHEVTHDILGIGDGGTIKVDKGLFDALNSGDRGEPAPGGCDH